jgi:hypothetical protein
LASIYQQYFHYLFSWMFGTKPPSSSMWPNAFNLSNFSNKRRDFTCAIFGTWIFEILAAYEIDSYVKFYCWPVACHDQI